MSLRNGQPVIEGAINGQKVGVLLDTGSDVSLVTKSAAERLGLATRGTSQWVSGFGGSSRVFEARIEELRLGAAVQKGIRVRVAGERAFPGVDFILGDDYFKAVDIEFDYARNTIRLFQPLDCKDAPLSYWDADAQQVPMQDGRKIVVPIKVNGRAADAMLDSGASSSVVALSFAADIGITAATPGVVATTCSAGIGAENVHSWVARFDTLTLGGEVIRDSRLVIADYIPDMSYGRGKVPEVILGTDFLRAHRVLVSRSQRKVYFSYTGGLIFPATPALDCDDRLKGKGVKEALAVTDEVIAKNPRDTKALLNRASLRIREKDLGGALPDLDAVIALEPDNAVALSARLGVRASLKDFDGALADSDAAIANGMRTASMYVARAGIRREQGDYPRVVDELTEAIALDPRHAFALRIRGVYRFELGKYEEAEKDFTSLLAIRPGAIDSIWIFFARAHRGVDGRADLEGALARRKDGEWPAPVMSYLLGRTDRDALLAAAEAGDEKGRKGRVCEARFYLAQRLITEHRDADARPLLESARDECPPGYIEQEAAVIALKSAR